MRIVPEDAEQADMRSSLDEIARLGAERMLGQAMELEVEAYIEGSKTERDEAGHALVVRNGHARERQVVCGAGSIKVSAPRVNDKRIDEGTGERMRFRSSILPPWMRQSPKVVEMLPLLYLHGLSTGDFTPALTEFFGSGAGLSPASINRLTVSWQEERQAFMKRSFKEVDYVYIWVDGVHFNVRLGDDDRLCCLVVIGVRLDGTKELVAIGDGYRESTESWAKLLRDLKKRGMRSPVLAVGDGALGFWSAARDVFPETRSQRDWVHKTANVLDALPKSMQPKAKEMIFEITNAENKKEAGKAVDLFDAEFSTRWPKAAEKITKDRDALLAFYDFPAEHWKHLRTTNPIESTFAPVRARTNITKGPGNREAGIAMVFKLVQASERRWIRIKGHEFVALVRAGAKFVNGKLVEGKDEEDAA